MGASAAGVIGAWEARLDGVTYTPEAGQVSSAAGPGAPCSGPSHVSEHELFEPDIGGFPPQGGKGPGA